MTISLATKGVICQGKLIINIIQRYILPFTVSIIRNPISFTTKIKNSLKLNVKSVNPIKVLSSLQNLFKYNMKTQSSVKITIKKICD